MTMSCEQVYMIAAGAGAAVNFTNTKRQIPYIPDVAKPFVVGAGVSAMCGQMRYYDMLYAGMAAYAGDYVSTKIRM